LRRSHQGSAVKRNDIAADVREEAAMSYQKTSKYISLILRHHPEVIGITLDDHGWADTAALIEGVSRTHILTKEILEEIVRTDEKQRYSFNEDHSKIRANQGHSIPVDVELREAEPPEILYHGTGEKYTASIEQQGLLLKTRLYVHLSKDQETAVNVGRRHGRPAVYAVDAGSMHRDGHLFYLSANRVWLVKKVPVKYLYRIR
jgi:putative RNA 2'-phosphotransferase